MFLPTMRPVYIATEGFDASDGEKWLKYFDWAKIPSLVEVVSLDSLLCRRLIQQLEEEDWNHIVQEDFRLDYFYDLDYLLERVQHIPRKNILGLYRNPDIHISAAPAPGFFFIGYDLIEEATQISALTNCGGFPDVFQNNELSPLGLIESFDRARDVREQLAKRHPEEPHAQCEMYGIWRMSESADHSEEKR